MGERVRRSHGEREEVIKGENGGKKERKDVADKTEEMKKALTTTKQNEGLLEKIKRAGSRIKEIWEKIIGKNKGFETDIVDPASASLGTIESDISTGEITVDGAYEFAKAGMEKIEHVNADEQVMGVLDGMSQLDETIEEIIVDGKSTER